MAIARYWKVVDAALIQSLTDLDDKITIHDKRMLALWEEHAPFEFSQTYGGSGFRLTQTIYGVVPDDKSLLLPENKDKIPGWKVYDRSNSNVLTTNGRTKIGKDFAKLYGKENSAGAIHYMHLLKIMEIPESENRNYSIPQLIVVKDIADVVGGVYIVLDSDQELDSDVRFEEVLKSTLDKLIDRYNAANREKDAVEA